MVQINRSNMPRRVRGAAGGNGSFTGQLQTLASQLPYLSQLSPADRMLVLVGASLLGVVSFSYFFLLSGIFSSSSGGGGIFEASDPRLSSALRKTGLSDAALLKRGGGRRISVGPKVLDSNENAVALDIISTLNCDALQEELERDWHTVLDNKKIEEENVAFWGGGAADGGANPEMGMRDYEGGMADDYAGELAGEVGGAGDAAGPPNRGIMDGKGEGGVWGREENTGGIGSGDGNEKLDDFMNRRRRRLGDYEDELARKREGGMMDDVDYAAGDFDNYGNDEPANEGLKLTARHLFCLAAEAITLPKSTTKGIPDPSTHCDINSFEIRDELLYLWSSARSQMPEDVIMKTLRLVTEHKETLRGHEVHVWYPDGDQGTEGMLRVLNSGYEGRQTYNFDSEPADSSHDDLYRFHDRKFSWFHEVGRNMSNRSHFYTSFQLLIFSTILNSTFPNQQSHPNSSDRINYSSTSVPPSA